MKNIIKNIIYFILSLFNYYGAVILLYHSVGENSELPTIKPDDFEKQLKYLSKNKFNVIKLTELGELIINHKRIPPKTVCLTFDDGYRDNFLKVFPALKKYNFPATIFMSTALIGHERISEKGERFEYLSEREIKEMSDSQLVDFGSHCHNHVKLTGIGAAEAASEFKMSKEILEKISGREVETMSYPRGRFNDEIEAVAKGIFKIICTVRSGRVTENDKSWRLFRNSINREVSFTQFKGIIKFGRI